MEIQFNDIGNCLFESVAGILLWMNVHRILKDKKVTGVSWIPTAFFALWGYWNLYYYPSLFQWWSFLGGIIVVSANTVWVVLAIYYIRKNKRERSLIE